MPRNRVLVGVLSAAVVAGACGGGDTDVLRVSGSTTVNPIAVEVAEILRVEGAEITVDSQGGSSGGLAQLGEGQVEVAMSSRPVTDDDRSRFPDTDFVETVVGADALGIVVRREVFDGGVTDLDRTQLQALFEGRVENWQELGGPDLDVFVYDKEPGRGTREVLDEYLYEGDAPPPPPDSDAYAIVGGNEESRTKAASTPGAVTPLSAAFVEGVDELVAISVEGVSPTSEHVLDGSYPLTRLLLLVTDGPPAGPAKDFVDRVLSAEGQRIVVEQGYVAVVDGS